MRLVIAHLAKRDLQAIARHSEKEWGAARKAQYMAAIRETFSLLFRRPAPFLTSTRGSHRSQAAMAMSIARG